MLRRLEPGDLPAFRALHDACLEVAYDDAFYGSLQACRDRHGHALLTFVALDAAGAVVGGLSVRLAPPAPPPSSDAAARAAWSWADLLLPLRYLGRALQALWQGDAEGLEADAAPAGSGSAGAGAGDALVAYIMTLCVAPSARRQGLARALMQALLDALPPTCAALELHMLEGNAAATRLYASLDFVRGARHPNYYFFQNAYHHAVTWRRDLGPAAWRGAPAAPAPGAASSTCSTSAASREGADEEPPEARGGATRGQGEGSDAV